MDFEGQALVEANNLTDDQINKFLQEIESIPSIRSPINGKEARLAFEFMEDTGGRVTEVIKTKKKDINMDARIWTVMHPKAESICDCSTWRYRDLYSRLRVLEHADNNCKNCHGKGRWKKPQRTTITPRLIHKVKDYCKNLQDEDLLFPVHRATLWKWAKKAGNRANINIFQQKEEKYIQGMFLHLFRALCSKRMVRDAVNDPYKDQLVARKLRHSFATVTDRYTQIDFNYLWNWENNTYGN